MKGLKVFFIVFGVVVVLAVIGAINRIITDGTIFTDQPSTAAPHTATAPARTSTPMRLCSNIITDEEMRDWRWGVRDDVMRTAKVQAFLEEKGSLLAHKEFGYFPAAYIVETAKRFLINPLVILVTMQKEQGLIVNTKGLWAERQNPIVARRINFAMGWKEPSDFLTQVYRGTAQFDLYLSTPWRYRFKQGVGTETEDGVMIWPQNDATAALYNYTPYAGKRCGGSEHVGGTGLFLQLWESWSQWKP